MSVCTRGGNEQQKTCERTPPADPTWKFTSVGSRIYTRATCMYSLRVHASLAIRQRATKLGCWLFPDVLLLHLGLGLPAIAGERAVCENEGLNGTRKSQAFCDEQRILLVSEGVQSAQRPVTTLSRISWTVSYEMSPRSCVRCFVRCCV